MRNIALRKKLNFDFRSVIFTLIVLFGIIVSQILMSISLSSGAYEIAELKQQNIDLNLEHQALSQELGYLTSPQHLAVEAEKLGMVTGTNPVFLHLSTGSVSGAPQPAPAGNPHPANLVPNALSEIYKNTSPTPEPSTTTPPTTATQPVTPQPNVPQVLTNGLPAIQTH